MRTRLLIILVMTIGGTGRVYAQFSPGELSKAHEELEGMSNCAKCHEVGKELSGQRCLDCHAEIKREIDLKRGYHYAVSSRKCTVCHKEHLGRDVRMTIVDRRTFEHALTGFSLSGKHASVKCEACHARKNVKDPDVLKKLSASTRSSMLGLSQSCASCHQDRHRNTLGTECQSCHTTTSWSPATGFDHSKTKFVLAGKHESVQCSKCHATLTTSSKTEPLLFTTQTFSDCTPCHTSPHSEKFSSQTCTSCHSPEGWRVQRAGAFDHNTTSFKLVGRHSQLQCQQCHGEKRLQMGTSRFKMAYALCTDCHEDYHREEFAKTYDSNCLRCHSQDSFSPSTFTLQMHSQTAFALKGAHVAIACFRCHARRPDGWRSFRLSSTTCASCHRDVHEGEFAGLMKTGSCDVCHTTDDWFPRKFDHGSTRFQLAGRHAVVKCASCHQSVSSRGVKKIRYRNMDMRCQSCHADAHAGQFAVEGVTDCLRCHSPAGWRSLAFDHNTQSAFALTGGHAQVDCNKCHHQELIDGKLTVRFKPLSTECESCHQGRRIGNG